MKIALRPAIITNMLLDLVPLGYAIYLTAVGASATDVPDAGLVVVVTVPLILLLGVDLLMLSSLGIRQRAPKFLLVYYALTRAVAVYAIYRLLVSSPVALMLGAPLALLALAAYTLMAISSRLRSS